MSTSTQLQPDLTVAEQARARTSVAMVTGSISRVGGGTPPDFVEF